MGCKERTMIDIKEMSKQHEQLFPLADLASQVLKLEEELSEVTEAKTDEQVIKELADCIICCIGMYRFVPITAGFLATEIGSAVKPAVEAEVERKWKVNLNRKWEWNGKVYKHVGKDGNE